MTQYSNPRLTAIINDWPTGKYRTTAMFYVEVDPKRGERAVRITKHPITGKEAAPKKLTYANKVRILDGDDGRTYIAHLHIGGGISIMRGDMKYQHEFVYLDSDRVRTLLPLFT